jgi:hypothetical protein
MSSTLYERDFFAWASEQAALVREGKFSAADIENLAEEIESLARSEKRELTRALEYLFAFLLTWDVLPVRRAKDFVLTIEIQRRKVARVMEDSPSLREHLGEILSHAYGIALLIAQRETGLAEAAFPPECPWTFDQAMHEELTPDWGD